jgi:hypothetical protein
MLSFEESSDVGVLSQPDKIPVTHEKMETNITKK